MLSANARPGRPKGQNRLNEALARRLRCGLGGRVRERFGQWAAGRVLLSVDGMSTLVMPQVLSGGSHAAMSPLKIWDLLASFLRRQTLSDDELRLLAIIRPAALSIGKPVLSASSLADLDARLDLSVASRDLIAVSQETARALTVSSLEALAAAPTVSPELKVVLGSASAKKLEELFPLVMVAVSVMFQLVATNPKGWLENVDEELFSSLLYDPDLPLQVRRCLFAALRSDVATLALAAALLEGETPTPLEPWLAHALVERIVEGQYERVRVLASIPDVAVPLDVLPLADRLNPLFLQADEMVKSATIEDWLAQAKQSDADVFLPEGDVGDASG